jgi:competence protein ComFC
MQMSASQQSAPGNALRRAAAAVLDLIYPPLCASCDRPGAGWLCAECAARLQKLSHTAQPTTIGAPPHTLPVFSCAPYAAEIETVIHAFKYRATPQLADVFAPWLIDLWQAHGLRADACIPVPLHRARMRERGFNQSAWLAKRFAKATATPCLERALVRTRNTRQQALLNPAERRGNVADAFAATPAIAGKTLVLIDDVLTTGATLLDCARACHQAGAKEVFALTIARA